jgi:hypothetical protein
MRLSFFLTGLLTMINTSDHTVQLLNAFSLTEDDLAANRAGHLADVQQGYLRRKRTQFLLGFLVAIIVSLVLGINGLATGGRSQSVGLIRDNSYGWGISLICFAIPIWLIAAAYVIRQIGKDLANNRVVPLQGMISRRMDNKTIWKSYKIVLGRKSFDINRAQYEAFADNERYTLYYTPSFERLVAAEPVVT